MKNAVFTIVAKNYFGLAEVLGESVRRFNPELNFHIFIADEVHNQEAWAEMNENNFSNWICKDTLAINEKDWYDCAFKYNITEFCTFLKPYAFEHLFKQGYEKVIYFDPDIFVFNSLNEIIDELSSNCVVLTPHITTIQDKYNGDINEQDLLATGIYNLGFLALRYNTSVSTLISWWKDRLFNLCYVDRADALFTDQKWMDFIPAFFHEGLLISPDLGRNLAPWNFYERQLIEKTGELYVMNRIKTNDLFKLIFVHYSGFDYKNLNNSNSNLPNLDLNNYPDLSTIFKLYKDSLTNSRLLLFLNQNYSYGNFENGVQILHLHRRLYRRILLENKFDFDNPFKVNGYYSLLLNKKLVDATFVKNDFDKMRKDDYGDYYKKVAQINRFFRTIKSLIGFKKYYMLSKFFIKYFRPENQYFLIDNKDISKTL